MSDRDVIAGVLGEHGLGWIDNGNPDLARCYCGHRPRLGDSWHGHVADALIAAGVTMPEERAMQMVCAAMNSGRTDAEKLSRIEVVVAAWVDHPASLTPTATVEGLAGVTVAAPTCGASAVIAGIEYECQGEPHNPSGIHACADGIGVMVWRDDDEGPEVVAAWTHEEQDGWPVRPARPWRKRCEGDADDERRCCLTEGHDGECR